MLGVSFLQPTHSYPETDKKKEWKKKSSSLNNETTLFWKKKKKKKRNWNKSTRKAKTFDHSLTVLIQPRYNSTVQCNKKKKKTKQNEMSFHRSFNNRDESMNQEASDKNRIRD